MTVGVVGAGVTGLALVDELASRGVDVVAFEAAGEPGGVVESRRVDGRVLEWGPQRLRLSEPVAELVAELDLEAELLTADEELPLYVFADGRLREVPRSPRAFLRTDLLSWRGKARALAEPLTDPARPGESAAEVFRRKFGTEAARNVVEPLFGGTYASDPARMPAEHALAPLLRLEERHGSLLRAAVSRLRGDATPPAVSFEDGLQTLPRALYERHSPYVHLDSPVSEVRRAGDAGESAGTDEGARFELRAGGRTVAVDDVVLTVPAPTAAGLLADLPGATADPLADLTYNSLALVFLRADLDREGLGYQVRRDEPLETLGVTWNASLFDRDGVYTAFLGGMDDPEVVDRDPEDLGAVAREEFRQVTGADAEVLEVATLPDVLPAWDESWSALDDVELPEGVELATNYVSRLGVPSRIREARRVAEEIATRRE